MNYLNEFTSEYWRGHEDRSLAPDYVARCPLESFHAPIRYIGRINGQITENQVELARVRGEILKAVYTR